MRWKQCLEVGNFNNNLCIQWYPLNSMYMYMCTLNIKWSNLTLICAHLPVSRTLIKPLASSTRWTNGSRPPVILSQIWYFSSLKLQMDSWTDRQKAMDMSPACISTSGLKNLKAVWKGRPDLHMFLYKIRQMGLRGLYQPAVQKLRPHMIRVKIHIPLLSHDLKIVSP